MFQLIPGKHPLVVGIRDTESVKVRLIPDREIDSMCFVYVNMPFHYSETVKGHIAWYCAIIQAADLLSSETVPDYILAQKTLNDSSALFWIKFLVCLVLMF